MPISIRDKIIANSQQFLEPGETVQAAFAGQTFNGMWALLSPLIVLFKNSYRAVVVTDRRILLLATGMWAKTTSLGETIYVHKRFHKDINAADGVAG